MKRIHAGHPVTLSVLLIFIASLASCSKAKKEAQEFIPIPDAKQISISYLKALSTAEFIKIKDQGVIRGVVISDASSKNVDNNRTLFLQEGNGKSGLMIKLKTDHNFILNDSLEINIFDQTLAKLNGAVVLQDLANALVKKQVLAALSPG